MAFGAIPFPDDLYRDASGRVRVLPGPGLGATALLDELVADQSLALGFSALSPVFLRVDGEVDAATLPNTPADSMQAGASLFLLDIDPSSPNAFSRVPIECHWSPDRQMISARAARGEPLTGGRKYALVATTRIEDATGASLQPSMRYREILAASEVPSGALSARAYRAHINAISAIENAGVERDQIAGLAVFTVQDVEATLAPLVNHARAFSVSAPTVGRAVSAGVELDALLGVPANGAHGVDAVGGVPHENMGWLIQGSVNVPNYLAGVATKPGRFALDGEGALVVQRVETLPFTLCLPMLQPAGTELPLIVFQHGLGRDRADVLPLANQLNAAGYAVLAIDAPYHGLRQASVVDTVHRFSSLTVPDGFADGDGNDAAGWFLGGVEGGDRTPLHPAYLRDALRQNVSDWLVTLRAFESDPAAWLASIEGLPAVSFSTDRIGFVGIDIGAQVGGILSSQDTRLDAVILVAAGGGLAEWVLDSPALQARAADLLAALGIDSDGVDYAADPLATRPSVALWQAIADPGDVLAFAPSLRRKQRDLLMVMARNDELMSNRTTEALAASLRLPFVGPSSPRYVTLSRANAPVSQNAMIGGELSTHALFEFGLAANTLYVLDQGVRRFEPSATPPFMERPMAQMVDNPIGAALTQAVFFFESWRNGSATVIDPSEQQRVPVR